MSKKVVNTRRKLIEVGRDLFAEHGKNGVTMNDIAEASKRGRRTLYTYFKSKDEIYKAVIDNELMKILEKLQLVSEEKTEPDVKLRKHILTHLDAVKWAVTRNGSLRSDFFRDIYEVERTRRKIDNKEIRLIGEILAEGVKKRIFKPLNIDLSAMMLLYSIKGLEVPYIRQNISRVFEKYKDSIVDIVFSGIKR
jgi:AcrR family transcriptional regulator